MRSKSAFLTVCVLRMVSSRVRVCWDNDLFEFKVVAEAYLEYFDSNLISSLLKIPAMNYQGGIYILD